MCEIVCCDWSALPFKCFFLSDIMRRKRFHGSAFHLLAWHPIGVFRFLVGVDSPGPNILAIIGTSMSVDRKSGISLALGVAMGSLTWGIWTSWGGAMLCYGETKAARVRQRATDAECRAKLVERLKGDFRAGLHDYFTEATRAMRLTPERDAAYVSLAYNVGIRGAGRSTATRRLNAGDIAGGCKALTWWNKAGGRVVRGLVNRRAHEYRLCMKGVG